MRRLTPSHHISQQALDVASNGDEINGVLREEEREKEERKKEREYNVVVVGHQSKGMEVILEDVKGNDKRVLTREKEDFHTFSNTLRSSL